MNSSAIILFVAAIVAVNAVAGGKLAASERTAQRVEKKESSSVHQSSHESVASSVESEVAHHHVDHHLDHHVDDLVNPWNVPIVGVPLPLLQSSVNPWLNPWAHPLSSVALSRSILNPISPLRQIPHLPYNGIWPSPLVRPAPLALV